MNFRLFFHYISYLQYPLMITAVIFAFIPIVKLYTDQIQDISSVAPFFNNVLIFMGLGLSFSTLQDTTKTQNKVSRKIWEHPKKGSIAIALMAVIVLFLVVFGLLGYYVAAEAAFKELAIGVIILGIGYIGVLRSAIEMFENHRLDKNNPN